MRHFCAAQRPKKRRIFLKIILRAVSRARVQERVPMRALARTMKAPSMQVPLVLRVRASGPSCLLVQESYRPRFSSCLAEPC
jgi:hypothetical protein